MEEIIKKLDENLNVLNYKNVNGDKIEIYCQMRNQSACCPCCGKETDKVNTKYIRTIKDLPIQESQIILKIYTRIFVCENEKCNKKQFSEKLRFVKEHSRMTTRLQDRIINVAKGMSARASKEIISKGLVNTSDDTILRLLKKNNKRN